jgi:hypothetical protein
MKLGNSLPCPSWPWPWPWQRSSLSGGGWVVGKSGPKMSHAIYNTDTHTLYNIWYHMIMLYICIYIVMCTCIHMTYNMCVHKICSYLYIYIYMVCVHIYICIHNTTQRYYLMNMNWPAFLATWHIFSIISWNWQWTVSQRIVKAKTLTQNPLL